MSSKEVRRAFWTRSCCRNCSCSYIRHGVGEVGFQGVALAFDEVLHAYQQQTNQDQDQDGATQYGEALATQMGGRLEIGPRDPGSDQPGTLARIVFPLERAPA